MIHAILIFGLGFTLFKIQERFDPQRVVNVKFANANFDSLGNLSSLNNTQETINDVERSPLIMFLINLIRLCPLGDLKPIHYKMIASLDI